MKRIATLLAVLAGAATLLAGCGGDDNGDSGSPSVKGNGVDRAFAEQMVFHHRLAVQMAELARVRATSAEIRELAQNIIVTQNREISQMNRVMTQLDRAGVTAGDLGVPEHMRGTDTDLAELRTANPFDRAFIDEMVPHHEGAITVARAELTRGENPTLRRLASAIIAAQQREIEEMRAHRAREFGSAEPAGGGEAMEDAGH
jgi:uncharacterized protein (DUF305 family)